MTSRHGKAPRVDRKIHTASHFPGVSLARITSPSELPRIPRFVVLEGVNGAGKSTLQRRLQAELVRSGLEVTMTHEPGATPIGKEIRSLLLGDRAPHRDPLTELLLFTADRAEHVRSVIRPALARGAHVLCDRYFYSTIAFQGYGRGLDRAVIQQLTNIAVGETLPDLVILLNLDPASGLRRTRGRVDSDAFEREELAFHERLHAGFLTLADDRPERFLVVDAMQSADAVFESVQPFVCPRSGAAR